LIDEVKFESPGKLYLLLPEPKLNSFNETPCSHVIAYQRFGGPCCFHLHGFTPQKTRTWISISVKTSNHASILYLGAETGRTDLPIMLSFDALLSNDW